MIYRFDLHIHSCLSPCGDLMNSPAAIAAAAKAAGLNGIMIADHNTARNCPALAEACARLEMACLFGMEITTAEEVHVLAAFDTLEQAQRMTDRVYAALPKRVNQPEIFGDQPVVTVDEEIVEMEWRLLSAPTRLTLSEVEQHVHGLGGLFVACHVDRATFSVFSQLGALSGEEHFDAVELTRYSAKADWIPKLCGLPVLRASDAHYLENIGDIWNEAELPAFSVTCLRQALREGRVTNP